MKRSLAVLSAGFAALLVLTAAGTAPAAQISFTSVSTNWHSPTDTQAGTQPGDPAITNGVPTSSIQWGTTDPGDPQSGYDFTRTIPSTQTLPPAPTPFFPLGTFTHRNFPVNDPSLLSVKMDVVLLLNVDGTATGPLTFTFTFNHVETPNNSTPCPYPTPSGEGCTDRVTFVSNPSPTTFNVGGVDYTLAMSFVDDNNNPVAQFLTRENLVNTANLVGRFTVAPPPSCGDNMCNGTDTCSNCPQDCGICPLPPPPGGTLPLDHIRVFPSSATLGAGSQLAFNAQGYDANDNVMPGVLFSWAAGGPNSVNPTVNSTMTILTAGSTPGVYTITASSGSKSGQAVFAVQGGGVSGGLWLVDPATANPNPVTGTNTQLHVRAQSTNPGPISYQWDFVGLAAQILSGNAMDSGVNFTQPGNYQFNVTIRDSAGLQLVTGVAVPVQRTITQVIVSPAVAATLVGQAFPFTARAVDQFNQPISSTFQWGSSAGSISAAGSFVSQVPLQNVTISARAPNGVTGTAQLTVSNVNAGASMDLSNAKVYPVPYKARSGVPGITFAGLTPDTRIRIFSSDGRLVQTLHSSGTNVLWDVTNRNQEQLASGVYFYIIENSAPNQKKEGKLVIIQ